MICPVCQYNFAYPQPGQAMTSGEAMYMLDHAKLCGLVHKVDVRPNRKDPWGVCEWKCLCGFYDQKIIVTGKHLATHHNWEKLLVRKALEELT